MAASHRIKLTFLGGASAIGASCALLEVAETTLLIDCGVRFEAANPLPDLSQLSGRQLDAIVLTPICPHSLTQRPLVMPRESEIEIVVHSEGSEEVALTVDGQEGMVLSDRDRVIARASAHPISIVGSPFRSRYEILHAKLRWGER